MPELPEVEIIKRQLSEYLVGHTIEDVEVRESMVVRGDSRQIIGAKVAKVLRRGKGLVIELDNGYSLSVHLKMTGQIIYRGNSTQDRKLSPKVGELPGKHTHVIFMLDDGGMLYFNDIRKFGWVYILPSNEAEKIPFFKNLGREPFSDLTFESFAVLLKSTRSPIKNVLMDQRKIAGVGNIYANDALWKAEIHPFRSANSISENEAKKLFESLLYVLEKGIREGAASENTYVDALGGEGNYQNHFLVYKKSGKDCVRCGGRISRFVLGGRGTFVCEECQK